MSIKENDEQTLIRVRLLGGEMINIRKGRIVGYCHNIIHPGKLTKPILEKHDCLGKQCPFLEKYEESSYWQELKHRQNAKAKARQCKKEKKAILFSQAEAMLKLRDDFQAYADLTDSPLDVIKVEHPNPRTYIMFYVSDNRFADGNRFPDFLKVLHERYTHSYVLLRHIKDVDGHFVTRD